MRNDIEHCSATEPDILAPDKSRSADANAGIPMAGELFAGLAAGVGHQGYLGPATVLGVKERERLVLVQWERAEQTYLSWARLALATSGQLKQGDTALVISQNLEEFYVIGALSQAGLDNQNQPAGLQTASGARVAVTSSGAEEIVQVHSSQGALVMEYRPGSGKTLVNIENGDLEFVTKNGGISFQSAKQISLVAKRLETRAETVVAKAGNVYETVEELAQLQSGRMRTLVKGSCHLKAREAFLKAEQDFKVDGKQIHLG
ncbi:MAG TPA: DUF3540 domain-containing protein [Alphaproteobacteria bacterium]|nr:DUF3540 domain-containing protein [Alphaproteobacteria bacterium]